jgi:multimeric flavodoxin WrbA
MKVLAIIGSPKGKGNSYRVTKQVEETMKRIDSGVEFDYLFLKSANLELCCGCFLCVLRGEQLCPIKDDRPKIEEQMMHADGVIFVSPVYVYNVSWLMKNFIDRFAYVSHRPRFHGKKGLVISTTGGVGLEVVLRLLAFPASTWGFTIVHKLGVRCPPTPLPSEVVEGLTRKTERAVDLAARRFYRAMVGEQYPSPGLMKLGQFMFQQDVFSRGEDDANIDYRYWKGKGWLEKDARYFYDAKINVFKRTVAWLMAKAMVLALPRPPRTRNAHQAGEQSGEHNVPWVRTPTR